MIKTTTHTLALFILSIFLTNIAIAQFSDPTSNAKALGITSGSAKTVLEMQKLMKQLNKDPKFRAIMDESEKLFKQNNACLKKGLDRSICYNQYMKKRNILLKQAGEIKKEKLAPIQHKLDDLKNPYKKK